MIRSIITAILVLTVGLASAQMNTAPTVKVTFPKDAKAGSQVKGTVEVTFSDGLHGYQNPPSEEFQIPVTVVVDTKGYKLKVTYPKGAMKVIGGDTKPAAVYEGTIKIPVTLTVPKSGAAGEVKITVKYQQCNDQACFPPDGVSSTVKIHVKK